MKKVIYLHRYPLEYESVQFPISKELLKRLSSNYDVTYLSMQSIAENKEIYKNIYQEKIPLKIDIPNPFDKLLKTILYYLYFPSTLKKLKKINPDFIICKETLPFIPGIVGKLKIPMLIDTDDWWWTILFGKYKYGKKFARVMEKFDVKKWNKSNSKIVAHSLAQKKFVTSLGMNPEKIIIVNAPLSKDIYFPANAKEYRKKLGFFKKDWIVTVHGMAHPNKDYIKLVNWWKEFEKVHPTWKLLIVGGGGEIEKIKNIVKIKNIKNVILTGWLETQEEVNLALNASDCLLAIRRNTSDSWGNIPSILYHNVAIGKPHLATGLPGMSEMIKHGINGYTYKPDNFNSFKLTLEEIYNNPKKAEQVGKQSLIDSKKYFDPETSIQGYIDIIKNTIK